jgi:hypothetical protein
MTAYSEKSCISSACIEDTSKTDITLIKATTKDTTAQVRIQTELTNVFLMKNGLKQGDRLATILFNLSLECYMKSANSHKFHCIL